MANVKLLFYGTEGSEKTIECYANADEELVISIDNEYDAGKTIAIFLDKETAIRFSKELRKEIAKLREI
jgi:hypothetical protein